MYEHYISQEILDTAGFSAMLRCEFAAIEIYDHAIQNLQNRSSISELEAIQKCHRATIEALGAWFNESKMGCLANCRGWGFFTHAMTTIAAMFGDECLFNALEHIERVMESLYRNGMGDPDLPDKLRFLIGSQLLPQNQKNQRRIKRIRSERPLANNRKNPFPVEPRPDSPTSRNLFPSS